MSGTSLVPTDIGSFAYPQIAHGSGDTHAGDWPANVIDRLGGIASWGSTSHHLIGGGAFGYSVKFAGAFYAGKSLGESLSYSESYPGAAIIYGDPLYRPSGAKIYLSEGSGPTYYNPYIFPTVTDGYTFTSDPYSSSSKLRINAFHGHANLDITNWKLSVCAGKDT